MSLKSFILDWKTSAMLSFYTILLFCLVCILFMLWYPYEPIRCDGIVLSKTVMRSGECATFQFVGEKFMDIPVSVSVNLTNGANILLMTYTSNNPKGMTFKPRQFILPTNLHPGQYRLMWDGVYSVNPLRDIAIKYYSPWITVVKDDIIKR
jgi:hypothetical protein